MGKNQKDIIMIGAGGHARTLISVLKRMHAPLIGVTSARSEDHGKKLDGIEVLGDDEALSRFSPQKILLVNGVGGDSAQSTRQKLFEKFKDQGFSFFTTIDPTTLKDTSVITGEGVQLQMGTIIQPGVRIGDNTIINTGVMVDHDCEIGNNCHVAPGVVLCGGVKIEDNSFIGAGCVVKQGVHIGFSCVVGAGSVVIKNLPGKSICFGHPARVIRQI